MQSLGPFQALADELELPLRGDYAAFRFLLKRMQHINLGRKSHRINRPIGVAAVILDQFEHAGTAKTFQRRCIRRRLAELRGKQRNAESATHGRRKLPQVPAARSDPDELLRFKSIHCPVYTFIYIIVKLRCLNLKSNIKDVMLDWRA